MKEKTMPSTEQTPAGQDCPGPLSSGSVVAFLQARMGSTRLPGKVLMPIQGQSILERAIRRLRAAALVDEIAVLTTRCREDDVVVEEAHRLGAWVYRGPELDVLRRFYEASEEFQPQIIIRATADNPLIDIDSVDRIVETLRSGNLDLCMESELPIGAATEAITARALKAVQLQAKEAHHREHVTLYIKDHPAGYRVSFPVAPEYVRFPQIRLTVDTPEDFYFVNKLIRMLPEGESPLPLREYLPLALSVLGERDCKAFAAS
jgi:spore coat polysaccharide biosynthesis protein SpsF